MEEQRRKAYSHSLKMIISAEKQSAISSVKIQKEGFSRMKGDLQASKLVVHEARKKYDHQIDKLVRQMAEQDQLPLQFPPLLRKSSYHNYRVLSHRPAQHQNIPSPTNASRHQLPLEKRTRTEEKEYELSKERDGVYAVVKHYREGSLKRMDLHLDLNKLKKWHSKNRDLAIQRDLQAYRPHKQPFHQLKFD